MGFFSWMTCDTGESIPSSYSDRDTFQVAMITPDGRAFREASYEGYGVFGGKDFYELLAELNGLEPDRGAGIDLCFKDNGSGDDSPGVVYPKLVEELSESASSEKIARLYSSLPNPTSCPHQGFFYQDEDEDDEDDDWEDDDDE
jgi:hypothetical protein